MTNPWRTLPPLLFTEHSTTSASARVKPISASGGGERVNQWIFMRWRCFTSSAGAPCPEPVNEHEASKKANNNLFSVLFFMTEGSVHITVRAHESKELSCVSDGAAAWNALKERFDGNTKHVRRACREKRFSKSMKPGGDPVDFIPTMDALRLRSEDMGRRSSTTRAPMLSAIPSRRNLSS